MTEEQAKQRFMLLNLTRLFGVGLAFAGIANISGNFLPGMAPVLGYILLVFGAADFFISPILLKRIWQKQDQ
jgi:ABC-type uncharacterized transport system permease subunit